MGETEKKAIEVFARIIQYRIKHIGDDPVFNEWYFLDFEGVVHDLACGIKLMHDSPEVFVERYSSYIEALEGIDEDF